MASYRTHELSLLVVGKIKMVLGISVYHSLHRVCLSDFGRKSLSFSFFLIYFWVVEEHFSDFCRSLAGKKSDENKINTASLWRHMSARVCIVRNRPVG